MSEIQAVRTALLNLHRELLEGPTHPGRAIRRAHERGRTLQAAADDLRFSWLRGLSTLVTDMD